MRLSVGGCGGFAWVDCLAGAIFGSGTYWGYRLTLD